MTLLVECQRAARVVVDKLGTASLARVSQVNAGRLMFPADHFHATSNHPRIDCDQDWSIVLPAQPVRKHWAKEVPKVRDLQRAHFFSHRYNALRVDQTSEPAESDFPLYHTNHDELNGDVRVTRCPCGASIGRIEENYIDPSGTRNFGSSAIDG